MKKLANGLAAAAGDALLFGVALSVAAAETPVLTVESNLYGTAFTNGYTSLKAEEEENEVVYDETTSAVFTLQYEDGTAVDDSLIDISNAYVTLDEGDGYYTDDFEFNGTELDAEFENGSLIYQLDTGDIEWKQPEDYEVDNGGLEWSSQGGDGNGTYVFNLSVHGITYDGQELDPASFRATVYIYGRKFTAQSSPHRCSSVRWGAAGYDKVELPFPEEKELEEAPEVSDEPV